MRFPGVAWIDTWCAVGCAVALAACATGGGSSSGVGAGPTSFTAPDSDETGAPPPAETYDTAPHGGGVLGGPQAARIADAVSDALRKRGDQAHADGALAAAGRRLARDAQEGRKMEMTTADTAARRAGFAGVVLWALVYTIDGDDSGAWREGLAQIAHNLPISRYGVSLSPGGRVVAVVLGSMEVTLDPFPRRLSPGHALRLTGEAAARFDFASVYLTGIDGQVQETKMPGRKISTTLALSQAGVYKVEVLGDGPTGPVVLVNVPVYVGVPEPADSLATQPGGNSRSAASAAAASAPVGAAEWQARMLELLNRARAQERLTILRPDAELAALALGHCQDMVKNGFFGHQSPTTGSPEDRVRRAGTVVSIVGENVAQADSPEAAHELLMGSPAHRANMLGAGFNHVGVGVAPTGQPGVFIATLVFGRRPSIPAAQLTAEDVKGAIAAMRAARGAAPVTIAPALQAAALAGVKAYANAPGGSVPAQQAFTASESALKGAVTRPGGLRGACAKLIEIVEPDDLTQYPELASPALRQIGVAITLGRDTNPPRLVVLLLLDGSGCR